MPIEHAAHQQRLRTAIDYAFHGHQAVALDELAHITRRGPDATFRLWQALAETAIYPLRHRPAGGDLYGLEVFSAYRGTDLGNAPAPVRTALRFLMAQAIHSRDTLEALFRAAQGADDATVMDEVLGLLLDAAAESARAQMARGTFGSGR
ncbi:hypothetical protein [Streptomyces sp. NPDC046862]|uniref:hypothetical protein n=1 Tax=Streptomyces sp. NPDC046862 TaxID=3154603 RepID=UPI003452F7D1